MKRLIDRIQFGNAITADGAMGTMLQQLCDTPVVNPEELNLTHPHLVAKVTQSYLEAGAEMVQTNSFGGSPLKLASSGIEARSSIINRTAVEIARQVAGDRAWIVGSIGPCGRYLEPFGDLSTDEFRKSCITQVQGLVEGGVDAVTVETVMDVEEAVITLDVVKANTSKIPVMVSVTCNKSPGGYVTLFGSPLKEAVNRLTDAGADIIGANCGTGMIQMIEIARQINETSNVPIMIRPNAGLPEVVNGVTTWCETPQQFAAGTVSLLEMGVSIVGGCCGTTPEHIRQIRKVIDDFNLVSESQD